MSQPTRRLISIESHVTKWVIETAVHVARCGPKEMFRETLLDHLPEVMTREESLYLTRELLSPSELVAAFVDPGAERYLQQCTPHELLAIATGIAKAPPEVYEWKDR
jgi:hypothetical protein